MSTTPSAILYRFSKDLLFVLSLAVAAPAIAMDCDRVSHPDGKALCKALFVEGDEAWTARSDFDSARCSSIRSPLAKSFCYAADNKQSSCEAELKKVGTYEATDSRAACSLFVSIGKKMRAGTQPTGTCSLGDTELDSWCDAMKSSRDTYCSRMPSDLRRTCTAVVEVLEVFWREPTGWEKISRAVATSDPRVMPGGPEAARERAIANDTARRAVEKAEDFLAETCTDDLSLAPLPVGVERQEYTREEYAKIWAKHQGHSLNAKQASTLMRGCIGITAANLSSGGDPLDDTEALFGNFSAAKNYMDRANRLLDWLAQPRNPAARWLVGDEAAKDLKDRKVRYVMFGKLFWSNQGFWKTTAEREERDLDAFPEDDSGRVDVDEFRRDYAYEARPGDYINFDYGFWDEAGSSFWHANHMEYSDPAKRASSPMKVYQSSAQAFEDGYDDFDRVVYGVALAEAFDAKNTATFWGRKTR